jgi:hypothetical protein
MSDETAGHLERVPTGVTDRVLLFLVPPMAFLPPLVHAYTTLKLQLGLHFWLLCGGVGVLAVLLGAALSWLASRGAHRPSQLAQAVLLGAVALLVVDLSTYGRDTSLLLAFLPWVMGIWAGLAALFWLLRGQLPKILFVGALALLLSTIAPYFQSLLPAPAMETRAADGVETAPVIYMVLDEMIGAEGIPRDIEGGEAAYQDLRRLFDKHGFRLFGNAFSRHSLTVRSVPNTLNFDTADNSWGMILRHSSNDIVQSVLLEGLAQAKPLVVYQTRHINFCGSAATRCETLQSFDAESEWVAQLGLGASETVVTLQEALPGSLVARANIALMAAVLGLDLERSVPEYFDVHAFPAWFDHFADDVVASGGKTNYFAHLLSPHAPYILDASCAPQPGWELPYHLGEVYAAGAELDGARDRHYRAYFRQMHCLFSKLDGLLTRLGDDPAFSDATIVLHGDHGSRISGARFAEVVTERDLIDNHAALYAIRAPGVDAGYDLRRVSVQQLTAEYLGGVSRPPAGSDDLSIVIDTTEEQNAVVLQMPELEARNSAPASGQ